MWRAVSESEVVLPRIAGMKGVRSMTLNGERPRRIAAIPSQEEERYYVLSNFSNRRSSGLGNFTEGPSIVA